MEVYVFQGTSGWWGFTPQSSGSNLPAESGPWTPDYPTVLLVLRDYPVQRRGVGEAEIIAGIEKQGYYLTNDAEIVRKLNR
jgi:hypothetical protein